MTTFPRSKVLGYGVCGANEKYLKGTLDEFKRLCDHAVILLNRTDDESVRLIESYGFDTVRDDREWGTNQHKIKQQFVESLSKYDPQWLICLDMDEQFDSEFTRDKFDEYATQCDAMYVYIVNLWNDGWNRPWSFWNIRAWKWNGDTNFVNRPLHCGLAPAWAYYYGSNVPVALMHYGLKEKESRLRKIERYKKFDPNAKYKSKGYYDALSSDDCTPLDMDYIRRGIIAESIPIKRKTSFMTQPITYVYVKSPDGRVMDIPESHLADHISRGFTRYEKPSVSAQKPVCEEIVAETVEVSTEVNTPEETAPVEKPKVKRGGRAKKSA